MLVTHMVAAGTYIWPAGLGMIAVRRCALGLGRGRIRGCSRWDWKGLIAVFKMRLGREMPNAHEIGVSLRNQGRSED
jgi:hypothetical protein